jgi:hypothetical protein
LLLLLLLLLLVELELCPARRRLLFWSDMVDELVGVSLMLKSIDQYCSVLVVIMVGLECDRWRIYDGGRFWKMARGSETGQSTFPQCMPLICSGLTPAPSNLRPTAYLYSKSGDDDQR